MLSECSSFSIFCLCMISFRELDFRLNSLLSLTNLLVMISPTGPPCWATMACKTHIFNMRTQQRAIKMVKKRETTVQHFFFVICENCSKGKVWAAFSGIALSFGVFLLVFSCLAWV